MKLKKVGSHLTNSYEQWREYLEDQKQYTIIRKHVTGAAHNLKDKLHSLNDKFLGKENLYHGVKSMRDKTNELIQNMKLFLKSKQIK